MGFKYNSIRIFLQLLRKISKQLQIGNPALKAPSLIKGPCEENERILYKIVGHNDVCIWQLNNVMCSGLYGGAIINHDNQVFSRFINYPWGNGLHPILTFPYIGKNIRLIEKAIFSLTVASEGNYYHWIADLLPRLLLIKKYKLSDFDERFIILHNTNKRYETETLQLLQIRESHIIRLSAFRHLNVKDLVIADYVPSNIGNSFPKWKTDLLHEFRNTCISNKVNNNLTKIYLVRGKQKTRNLIGEEKLIAFLQKEGFQIIDPQKISLKEQIIALSNANTVIALQGAALTNILFCQEHSLIIELRSSHLPPDYFSEISKTCNLKFEYIELDPARKKKAPHIANKQDLLLSSKDISEIKKILSFQSVGKL